MAKNYLAEPSTTEWALSIVFAPKITAFSDIASIIESSTRLQYEAATWYHAWTSVSMGSPQAKCFQLLMQTVASDKSN